MGFLENAAGTKESMQYSIIVPLPFILENSRVIGVFGFLFTFCLFSFVFISVSLLFTLQLMLMVLSYSGLLR